MSGDTGPALVPELCGRDFARSLTVYTGIFGFSVRYGRDGFALLERDGAVLMLEQLDADSWLAAPAEAPLGRGMNLEIGIVGLGALLDRAAAGGIRQFREPEDVWYRGGDVWLGQRQAILMDPDGYLLRFCESLGRRAEPGPGRVEG